MQNNGSFLSPNTKPVSQKQSSDLTARSHKLYKSKDAGGATMSDLATVQQQATYFREGSFFGLKEATSAIGESPAIQQMGNDNDK